MLERLSVAALVVLIPLTAGCASAKAKAAEQPGLVVPAPPPHVVPLTPEPVIEPVADIPATPSATPAPKPGRGTRDVAPKPAATESKPETKPDAAAAEAPPPVAPVNPPPPAPAPQLRTAESTGADAVVRATIERTRSLLENIDYRKLNANLKKAYDDAKRFSQQAEDSLKAGNTVFAKGVADKAETLAKALANR